MRIKTLIDNLEFIYKNISWITSTYLSRFEPFFGSNLPGFLAFLPFLDSLQYSRETVNEEKEEGMTGNNDPRL